MNKTPIQLFLEQMNTPEGQAKMDVYFEKLHKKEVYDRARLNRAILFSLKLDQSELDTLVSRIVKKEEVFKQYWMGRSQYRISHIMTLVLDVIISEGGQSANEDNTFSTGVYSYRGYSVEIMQGQGTAYHLYNADSCIYYSN
jgi:hypothetical protein